VSVVYFRFEKGEVKYGGVQLSKMWVDYRGTVHGLVIMFCVSCAENDSAVLMTAEGYDSHVPVVLPV